MKLPKELTTITPISKILAAILFISLPFIGFLFGMQYEQTPDQTKESEINNNTTINHPTPTPLAIPTIDPSITVNWKTYKNSKYNFSFMYPLEAVGTSLNKMSFLTQNPAEGLSLKPISYEFGKSYILDIVAEDNNLNLNTNEVLDKYLDDFQKKQIPVANQTVERIRKSLKPYKNGEINGTYGTFGYETEFALAVDARDGKIYTFTVHDGNGYTNGYVLEIFDQILSTFQFSN